MRGVLNIIAIVGVLTGAGWDIRGESPGKSVVARAQDIGVREVYWPAVRPGWACWPTVWQDTIGGLYVTFQEIRQVPNPTWEPVPLDFWEAMGLPHTYYTTLSNGSKDLTPEVVILKSRDGGSTWAQSSRFIDKYTAMFAWESLSDGRIVRMKNNDYLAWHKGEDMQMWSEISADGGKTWKRQATLMEGYSAHPYRLRRMRDGSLVTLGTYSAQFGPGRELASRHTKRPHVRQEFSAAIFVSRTGGASWEGPLPVLPGIIAHEPDFVELPSGDLLIVNSTVQGGPQVRQMLRRIGSRYVPGPVFDVVSGRAPECLVVTKAGLLVGSVRGGDYTVSNDLGATWHKIEDLPKAGYQPFVTELPGGRLFCVFHVGGGDVAFGKNDLHIGAHIFRLEANLPQPTRLAIARELDAAGQRYANSYLVTLTGGGEPAARKTIRYTVEKREGYYATGPAKIESTVITDAKGQARIDLTGQFAEEKNIHLSYHLDAWFEPPQRDRTLSPCRADRYFAYVIKSTKRIWVGSRAVSTRVRNFGHHLAKCRGWLAFSRWRSMMTPTTVWFNSRPAASGSDCSLFSI